MCHKNGTHRATNKKKGGSEVSRINYVDGLAIEREQILLKIYLTKTDIRNFLRCGCPEASAIYEQARKLCEKQGKKNLPRKAYYKNFLEIVGINEKDVHHMAKIEIERNGYKKDAPSLATNASNLL